MCTLCHTGSKLLNHLTSFRQFCCLDLSFCEAEPSLVYQYALSYPDQTPVHNESKRLVQWWQPRLGQAWVEWVG